MPTLLCHWIHLRQYPQSTRIGKCSQDKNSIDIKDETNNAAIYSKAMKNLAGRRIVVLLLLNMMQIQIPLTITGDFVLCYLFCLCLRVFVKVNGTDDIRLAAVVKSRRYLVTAGINASNQVDSLMSYPGLFTATVTAMCRSWYYKTFHVSLQFGCYWPPQTNWVTFFPFLRRSN
jgi:hypothetical protein